MASTTPWLGRKAVCRARALTDMSTRIIARIAEHTGGSIPIVGVGGVMGPEDARAKLDAGATLIQLYTGLVYEGPGLVKRILRALSSRAEVGAKRRRQSRDPPKSESVPNTALSGEVGGSFDSSARGPSLRMTETPECRAMMAGVVIERTRFQRIEMQLHESDEF